jgi:hypothetical protein
MFFDDVHYVLNSLPWRLRIPLALAFWDPIASEAVCHNPKFRLNGVVKEPRLFEA